ncbi:MAG: hypothetical protein DRN12_06495 [Thermoplasmata archaeon]|nr:MAG: hypothetical protein DRN12_06495 [Thermoplasmata archaeon]
MHIAKHYVELDKPIREIPADKLRNLLGGLKNSELLRTIILNEKQFLTVDYDRSLRSFWYTSVKPVLDKLGLLSKTDMSEEGLTRWDSELSRYMSELVKLGVLSYQDLRIIDTSRLKDNPSIKYHTPNVDTYGYEISIPAYPNIILGTEKDTIWNIIHGMSNLFGCSCISGKGQNSLGAMEVLIRGILEVKPEIDRIYILTLTDYDPAGYYIADTFYNQAKVIVKNLGYDIDIYAERLGIFPGQLTEEEIEQNKYTPKPANRDKWFTATGGINGEPYGLELDALPPDRIREIFVSSSLKKYIDTDVYREFVKKSYIKKVVLEYLEDKVDSLTNAVIERELVNVKLVDFNIFDLAIDGYSYLPVKKLCLTDRDDQIKSLLEHLWRVGS